MTTSCASPLLALLALAITAKPCRLEAQQAAGSTVYVRASVADLRLQPEFGPYVSLDSAAFGEAVRVLRRDRGWLLVRRDSTTPPGWIHQSVATPSRAGVAAIRSRRRIQVLVLYVDADSVPITVLGGALPPGSDSGLARLPVGTVVLYRSPLPTPSFLNGTFVRGHPRRGGLYYLTGTGRFVPWP